jgi:flavin reductase (DIM6/NTAB) family NADH-FMN oxidoreductase RutF
MSETPIALDCTVPIWDRFYLVHPLVIIGSVEPDGTVDLAPKHMAGPVSWENHFGFVCCETHATYCNIVRTRAFTVSYPTPEQLVETSLTSAPRSLMDSKPSLEAVPIVPASVVEGGLVRGARIHLECELERVMDNLGTNSLIVGRVVAAAVDERALRVMDREDEHVIADAPVLAYLQPNRFCVIEESRSFPFYSGGTR